MNVGAEKVFVVRFIRLRYSAFINLSAELQHLGFFFTQQGSIHIALKNFEKIDVSLTIFHDEEDPILLMPDVGV